MENNNHLVLTPVQAEALAKAAYFTLAACFDIDTKLYRKSAMRVLQITPEQVDELMMLHAQLTVDLHPSIN